MSLVLHGAPMRGGCATVFQATHSKLGKIAVKVSYGTPDSDRMLRREYNTLKLLEMSPYVPKAYGLRTVELDLGEGTTKHLALLMEWIPGVPLSHIVRKRLLSKKESYCLAKLALTSCKSVHDVWILHRDAHCSNLMVEPDGSVRLIDLGTSGSAYEAQRGREKEAFKNGFQAPETLSLDPVWTKTADIYSLAACTVWAASGTTDPSVLPNRKLREWASVAMSPDVDCRFKNCSEAICALDSAFPRYANCNAKRVLRRALITRFVPCK